MDYVREAKEFLKNYRDYVIAQENLKDRLKELNTTMNNCKMIDYSGMPRAQSTEPDDRICNLIFERDETKKCLEENTAMLEKAKKIIANLTKEQQQILELSYIAEDTDTAISLRLHMSPRTFYRAKSEAIRTLARQLWGISAS